MTTSPINPEKPTIAAKPKMNHVAPVPPPGKQLETPLSPKEPTISPTALARLKEAAAMESAYVQSFLIKIDAGRLGGHELIFFCF